ncbi:tricalbin [Dacryopinax primogenitus]|uniref:Tricalbin n=1 Tax=Dacryopinax primogenitus (strain DJM 731) TaxID=1858805 RepID=M5FX15_DACPD|nr:tricalbin [Dacryopinax primogenitus]EJT98006.1 tricalbin [Dacryopinax primogenitus]
MATHAAKDSVTPTPPTVVTVTPPEQVADPAAVVNGIVKDAEKGAAVYTFDPKSTPEQKAAAPKKQAQAQGLIKSPNGKAAEIPAVTAKSAAVRPTITIDDVAKTNEQDKTVVAAEPKEMPGGVGDVFQIPEWYRVGWRQGGGIDRPGALTTQDILNAPPKPPSLLSQYIPEEFYGAWYWDASVIVMAVAFTHLLTILHLGWGWIFLLMATCGTYYSVSNERMRGRARDDIRRELVKNRAPVEPESAEWINSFLERFWLIYENVLSTTVVQSVEAQLAVNTPPMVESMHLTTFILGNKAPRIDMVKTYPKTEDDVVLMEWKLSFTPNDASNTSLRKAADRVNPKIVFEITVGKSVAKVKLPILLENFEFRVHVQIKLDLMTTPPHAKRLEISFLEKPFFDFELKPIGGETFGFDIGFIPGLRTGIRDMVHSILGPMMYAPNAYVLDLAQLLSGAPLDTAIGVLQVRVVSARGIKGVKVTGGAPDPYVSLSINEREELARTKYQPATYNPYWGEIKFLLINSLREPLTLGVVDYNEHRKDMNLGTVTWPMESLQDDVEQDEIVGKIMRDGQVRGELQFDVSFFPVLKPQKGPDGELEPLPDTKTGILRVTIHQAKKLDTSKSGGLTVRELNPYAKLLLGGQEIFRTKLAKGTNNPVWEAPKEMLVHDRHARNALIGVEIIDDRDILSDPVVGRLSITVDDLLKAGEAERDRFPLVNCKTGWLRMSAEWKPLNMAGSIEGASAYVPPIGVVRLWIQKASEVQNVEALMGGKSDPYVRVMLNGVIKVRTEVVNNNLNPEWDQIIYVPVHQLRESLMLELMDYQNLTKDRSLGSVELKIADLASVGGDSRIPYKSKGKRTFAEPIRLDRGKSAFKGKLFYVAEFLPGVHLKNATFKGESNEIQENIAQANASQNADGVVVKTPRSADTDGSEHSGSPVNPPAPTAQITITPATPQVNSDSAAVKSHKRGPSIDSVRSDDDSRVDEGVEMTSKEVLESQSGIIAFDVISGHLARKSRLEILLDESYWPAFGTIQPRSPHARWEQAGEGFVKELDFSQLCLRLNQNDEGDKEEIVAELKMDTKKFLEMTLDKPSTFTLTRNGGNKSTVEIQTRYIPVHVVLEPRESVNNMGILSVTLLYGDNIRGVDRRGTSDPFVVFKLNGQRVHKSETKKKTLKPEWNENFSMMVTSRVDAQFSLEVFDWNQIENDRTLGEGAVDITSLEPFVASEVSIPIADDKHGNSGEIKIRLLFTPQIIARQRQPTSTFGDVGRAMTRVGTMPLAGGRAIVTGVGQGVTEIAGIAGGVVGVGSGIGHGISDVGSGIGAGVSKATNIFRRKDKDNSNVITEEEVAPASAVPASMAAAPVLASVLAGREAVGMDGPSQTGYLRVRIVSAKGLAGSDSLKPEVHLRVAEKEFKTKHAKGTSPEWDETFPFMITSAIKTLSLTVLDHRTIGKDKELAEAHVDIWSQIATASTADTWVELSPEGQLHVRLEFSPGSSPGGQTPPRNSISMSGLSKVQTPSKGSPSRFSLKG